MQGDISSALIGPLIGAGVVIGGALIHLYAKAYSAQGDAHNDCKKEIDAAYEKLQEMIFTLNQTTNSRFEANNTRFEVSNQAHYARTDQLGKDLIERIDKLASDHRHRLANLEMGKEGINVQFREQERDIARNTQRLDALAELEGDVRTVREILMKVLGHKIQ